MAGGPICDQRVPWQRSRGRCALENKAMWLWKQREIYVLPYCLVEGGGPGTKDHSSRSWRVRKKILYWNLSKLCILKGPTIRKIPLEISRWQSRNTLIKQKVTVNDWRHSAWKVMKILLGTVSTWPGCVSLAVHSGVKLGPDSGLQRL